MDQRDRDPYTGHSDSTAAEQVQGIINSTANQVEKRSLSSASYKLKVQDAFGNTVEIEGTLYGEVTR